MSSFDICIQIKIAQSDKISHISASHLNYLNNFIVNNM